MILTGDYHTHTPYSHGKNTVMENALAAKKLGLKAVGITDHGFNHILFGLRRRKLAALRAECDDAERATGVNVLMGMESNLTSANGDTDMKAGDLQYFDIYLCGLHELLWYRTPGDFFNLSVRNYFSYVRGRRTSDRLFALTTKAYIEAVKKNPIDILTHINFRCCCDVVEVAKCCADYGTYIEINAKKTHLTDEELSDIAAKTSVRFLIGSDAHSAARVGEISLAEALIRRVGLDERRIDNIDGRLPDFRFRKYKEKNG